MSSPHDHFLQIGGNVGYDDARREYFIVVRKIGNREKIVNVIQFCPVCGEQFPSSLRDEWFDRLEGLGINPMTDRIPIPYNDGTWWRDD